MAVAYVLQVANYLVPLATLPFLVRVLGAEAYGALAFAYVVMMFAVLLIDAGLDTLSARRLSRPEITSRDVSLPSVVSNDWVR